MAQRLKSSKSEPKRELKQAKITHFGPKLPKQPKATQEGDQKLASKWSKTSQSDPKQVYTTQNDLQQPKKRTTLTQNDPKLPKTSQSNQKQAKMTQ